MPENNNNQVTFPFVNVQVGLEGIVISYAMSPNASFNIVLDENTVNNLLHTWVQSRKDKVSHGQLVDMVRKNPHGNRLA